MVIVTTSYNCAKYIEQCIGSIMGQTFKDFKCYITDDMSTDNSVKLIKDMIKGDDRFILIENTEKMYQPGNYDQVIRNNPDIDDNEIIVEIDGDDWLPDSKTLLRINEVYKSSDIWIANGSFKYSNGGKGFAAPPKDFETLRQQQFTASHIRTWRAFLWRAIDQDYLKDDNGVYWEVAGDLAFMFPMLEMAGPEHYLFMDEVNYIYNEQNPLNDHKVNMGKVNLVIQQLRARPKYERLIR
jgi:glycosyltransferase involved in cell wall biosynthesis